MRQAVVKVWAEWNEITRFGNALCRNQNGSHSEIRKLLFPDKTGFLRNPNYSSRDE